MSLLDALLEDALYDPPVVAQDVYFARRADSAPGAGTADDPYRANTASEFDALMNDASKTPANTTIHLGPGTFETGGFSFTSGAFGGWSPRSGHRIVGAGMKATTLKLVNVPSGRVGHAIGMDLTATGQNPPFLLGFELSDLTIDANAATNSNSACGAVHVTGKDIYIRRVRVKGVGCHVNTSFSVILAGKARQVYPYEVENCVIEECIFQDFDDLPTGVAKLLAFEGEMVSGVPYAARFCVIRGCHIDGANLADPIIAISPGLALGTIIEQNQVYNCKTGLDLTNSAAQDLVIWDNFFHKVSIGMNFSNTTSDQVKRLVLLSNIVSLNSASTSRGISVAGSGSASNFLQLVARHNIIRDVTFPAGNTSGMIGVTVANVQEAIVEDNLINNCASDRALIYTSASVQYMKSFNNQTTAGALMRAYDSASGRSIQELADAAEDALLALALS